jgi:cell wall-associated NlpC family hydrolase
MSRRPLIRAVPALLLLAVGVPVVVPVTGSPVALADAVVAKKPRPANPEALALRGRFHAPERRNPEALAIRYLADTPRRPPTLAERAASFALEAVGVPYRYGGESPGSGFDCSGLVRWAYGRAGVDVPHNSYALYGVGRRVAESSLAPGDVLFFEGLGHVGLYLGGGEMVHAPYTGKHVEVIRLAATNYGRRLIGARRMAGSSGTAS